MTADRHKRPSKPKPQARQTCSREITCKKKDRECNDVRAGISELGAHTCPHLKAKLQGGEEAALVENLRRHLSIILRNRK